ncbi:MAG TPA: hypothetical protein VJ577_17830 [Burkholderiaceae bacterium]|nr:hypothetical protein [Burkholderiaceae bacterium]
MQFDDRAESVGRKTGDGIPQVRRDFFVGSGEKEKGMPVINAVPRLLSSKCGQVI